MGKDSGTRAPEIHPIHLPPPHHQYPKHMDRFTDRETESLRRPPPFTTCGQVFLPSSPASSWPYSCPLWLLSLCFLRWFLPSSLNQPPFRPVTLPWPPLPSLFLPQPSLPKPGGAAARLTSQGVLLLELSRRTSSAFDCPATQSRSYAFLHLGAHKRSKDLPAPKPRRLVFTNTGLTHMCACTHTSFPHSSAYTHTHPERTTFPERTSPGARSHQVTVKVPTCSTLGFSKLHPYPSLPSPDPVFPF